MTPGPGYYAVRIQPAAEIDYAISFATTRPVRNDVHYETHDASDMGPLLFTLDVAIETEQGFSP